MQRSEVVETYKRLAVIERASRGLKSVELAVRPIFHYREDRVRAHLFLCFLAYYVRWHLDAGAASLSGAARATIAPGSRVQTDGWNSYLGLEGAGYDHLPCTLPK
ncbi:MAG TPA: hypothetical protein VFE45_13280, partial [Coriobacteriia bacterium]|nr:hypothetical protein [Coriobacteriia bacterium]